jgi:quercetin dioxygenase-like cupin family protein
MTMTEEKPVARGDVIKDPRGGEVVLGDIGTSIVFENEHVRVWEVRLEPGQVQEWHLHHNSYLIVGIETGDNRMEFLDGSEERHMHEPAGQVVFREAGKVHKLTNEGSTLYINRLIELKHLGEAAEGSNNGR